MEQQPSIIDRDLHALEVGDEVAVMPLNAISDDDVLEIATVSHVRAFTIQLTNGKLYARTDGRGLVTNEFIHPASRSHKLAIERRSEER